MLSEGRESGSIVVLPPKQGFGVIGRELEGPGAVGYNGVVILLFEKDGGAVLEADGHGLVVLGIAGQVNSASVVRQSLLRIKSKYAMLPLCKYFYFLY